MRGAYHNPAGHCEWRNTRPVCVGVVFSRRGLWRRRSECGVCHHDVGPVSGRTMSCDCNYLFCHLVHVYLMMRECSVNTSKC